MNFLILGDIVGNPGQLALNKNLKELIQKNQIIYGINLKL